MKSVTRHAVRALVVHRKRCILRHWITVALTFTTAGSFTFAQSGNRCSGLPTQAQLRAALSQATDTEASGLNMNMWGSVVDRDGIVCAVAFTGMARGSQWPGSRVISAQKANTANAFSLDPTAVSGANGGPLALSTANLYSAVQPGGSLFGLQDSNPVNTVAAYKGSPTDYGTAKDPLVGERIGGINIFGGGLALYNANHELVGGLGVSGDTSCADHMIAWRTRHNLNLDHLGLTPTVIPGPASLFNGDASHPDNIIFDISPNLNGGTGVSPSGFGHPTCFNQTTDPRLLPQVQQ